MPDDTRPDRELDGDLRLIARIRAEIERDGPITFARFMALALYDADGGYYRGAQPRPGRAGDFLTAPEAHPIFGWAVARQLEDVWRRLGEPVRFGVREYGAGTGALAVAILDGLARETPALGRTIRYEPVEVEPRRLDQLAVRLAEAGHADALRTAGDPPAPLDGVVLANEVLDALPVHRVVARDGGLREVLVGWDGTELVDVEADPTTPALAERLAAYGIDLVDGQQAEICLALDDWIAETAAGLRRGVLLVIDYGYRASELYDATRRYAGTLLAYRAHRVHDDLYAAVGRQDLTAHVDLTAVERAAIAAGLESLGSTTQAEFLVSLGVEQLLRQVQEDPATSLGSYAELRSALYRMLDPAVTGRFRVLAFGRGLAGIDAASPLRGFAFRLPR